jgi:hypothetical protein
MMELVDIDVSKASARKGVRVRIPLPAQPPGYFCGVMPPDAGELLDETFGRLLQRNQMLITGRSGRYFLIA